VKGGMDGGHVEEKAWVREYFGEKIQYPFGEYVRCVCGTHDRSCSAPM